MRLVIAEDSVPSFARAWRAFWRPTASTSSAPPTASMASSSSFVMSDLDVAIVDIRLPPSWTDEGIRAAEEIRTDSTLPTSVLVLSQYADPTFALRLSATVSGASAICARTTSSPRAGLPRRSVASDAASP